MFPCVIQGQLLSSLGLSFPLWNTSVWTSSYIDSFQADRLLLILTKKRVQRLHLSLIRRSLFGVSRVDSEVDSTRRTGWTLRWTVLIPKAAVVGVPESYESGMWDRGSVRPLCIIVSAGHPASKQEVAGVGAALASQSHRFIGP